MIYAKVINKYKSILECDYNCMECKEEAKNCI